VTRADLPAGTNCGRAGLWLGPAFAKWCGLPRDQSVHGNHFCRQEFSRRCKKKSKIVSSAAKNISPRKPWVDGLLIVLFAALLWLPTVDFFSGVDRTEPPGENRMPAPKPRLTQWNLSGAQT